MRVKKTKQMRDDKKKKNKRRNCLTLSTHSRLLGQVGVHLLLAERRHFLDLLVVALHPLLILGYLLGIQQLVGRRVLK